MIKQLNLRQFLILCLCVSYCLCSSYEVYDITKFCKDGNRKKVIELEDDDESTIVLRSGYNYRNYLDCSVAVEAEKGYGITITLRKVHLRNIVDKLGLEISESLQPEWTGSKITDNEQSVSYIADRRVGINFSTGYSSESTKYKEFILILTAHRLSNRCKHSEVTCDKNRCISGHFRCDGINNCGNNADEAECLDESTGSNLAVIGSLMAGLVVLLLVCYCCRCCCCCCGTKSKNKKDYIPFHEEEEEDTSDADKIETHFENQTMEPSAPMGPNDHIIYSGNRSPHPVRYPVNPNYPYFMDGATPPPLPNTHSSDYLPNYMAPPPPYTLKAEN